MIIAQHKDGSVSLTTDGRALTSMRAIVARKDADNILKYIYYMYDPDSKFANMLPGSRKKLIEREILGEPFKEDKEITAALKTFMEVATDPKFALLEGVKKKIEEFIEFFANTAIDLDNFQKITGALVSSEKLLTIRKKLEDEVMSNKNSKVYGGGEASLFEDHE